MQLRRRALLKARGPGGYLIQGFTLVELIVVIVVLGAVAAASFGRFSDSGSYNEAISKDSLLSAVRSAQQLAFDQSNVSVKIEASGSNIIVSSMVSGAAVSSRTFASSDVLVTAGAVGNGTSCGTISAPLNLTFDGEAEIEFIDSDGFPICLNGSAGICVSVAGYAHDGACL